MKAVLYYAKQEARLQSRKVNWLAQRGEHTPYLRNAYLVRGEMAVTDVCDCPDCMGDHNQREIYVDVIVLADDVETAEELVFAACTHGPLEWGDDCSWYTEPEFEPCAFPEDLRMRLLRAEPLPGLHDLVYEEKAA